MPESKEPIFESAPSAPDDDFWLEQGKKMVEDSLTAVRAAAKHLLTGLEIIMGIYLGILGFADFIPKELPLPQKALFVTPLLLWLISLYSALQVMMTRQLNILLHSPDDIREKSEKILLEKQTNLKWAFTTLAVGLVTAFVLLIFRLKI
jgi:hypothetical protein